MYTRKSYNGLACGSPRRASLLLAPVLTRRGRSRRAGLGDVSSTQNQIVSTANQYGVPPSIALAVAQIESSFNPAAVGPVTSSGQQAVGLFQLMPGTASDMGVNPSDPSQNIQGGVSYLSQLYNQFGDWGTALAAYFAGPGNISKGIDAGGSAYASKVLSAQSNYLGYDSAPVSDSSGLDLSSAGSSLLPDSLGTSDITPLVILGVAGMIGLALVVR